MKAGHIVVYEPKSIQIDKLETNKHIKHPFECLQLVVCCEKEKSTHQHYSSSIGIGLLTHDGNEETRGIPKNELGIHTSLKS